METLKRTHNIIKCDINPPNFKDCARQNDKIQNVHLLIFSFHECQRNIAKLIETKEAPSKKYNTDCVVIDIFCLFRKSHVVSDH